MARAIARSTSVKAPAVTGNQSITITDFGTPKTARVRLVRADVSAVNEAHMGLSVGFTDGTRERCAGISVEHDVGTSQTQGLARNDALIVLPDPATGAIEALASFNAWITDGIQINWSDVPDDDWFVIITLYGGTDYQGHVNEFTVTSGTSINVTDPSFEPDRVDCFTIQQAFGGGSSPTAPAKLHYGICVNDGGADPQDQRSIQRMDDDNVGTTASSFYHDTSHVIRELSITAGLTAIKLENFDGDGFDAAVDSFDSASIQVAYLAHDFGGAVEGFNVQDWIPNTSTGLQADTVPGFEPQHLDILSTNHSAEDAINTAGPSGTAGLGETDGVVHRHSAFWSRDNQATSAVGCRVDAVVVRQTNHTGAAVYAAEHSSFDSGGFTLNITDAAPATRHCTVACIGKELPTDIAGAAARGESRATGNVSAIGVLKGTARGRSFARAAVVGILTAVGSVVAQGSAAAAVTGVLAATGSVAASSAATASPVGIGVLSGAVDAASVGAGAVVATGGLLGKSAAESQANAAPIGIGVVQGQSSGEGRGLGQALATGALVGISVGAGAAEGLLTALASGAASGTASGESGASGVLTALAAAIGQARAEATAVGVVIDGSVVTIVPLSASIIANSSVSGSLSGITIPFAGTVFWFPTDTLDKQRVRGGPRQPTVMGQLSLNGVKHAMALTPGILEAALRDVSEVVINTVGATQVCIRRITVTRNRTTGARVEVVQDFITEATPPAPFKRNEIDGTSILAEDMQIIVPAKTLGTMVPAPGDKVIRLSKTWQIIFNRPVGAGDDAAIYKLQLRE